jgi:hypothetical protein
MWRGRRGGTSKVTDPTGRGRIRGLERGLQRAAVLRGGGFVFLEVLRCCKQAPWVFIEPAEAKIAAAAEQSAH